MLCVYTWQRDERALIVYHFVVYIGIRALNDIQFVIKTAVI